MISNTDILNGKILIVDSLESNIRLLEQMLADAGYTHVSSTKNPQEVCGLHRKHHYDLILLDLNMPDMDGFAILDNLKNIEIFGYAAVIAVTAQPSQKLLALEAGAKDFLSKPFDPAEIKARIHNMLEVRLLYRQIEQYNEQLQKSLLERTAELRASEERFQRLTELSSDWYWEQDENGHFTQLSGPALEMLGIHGESAMDDGTSGDVSVYWNEAERAELVANIAARRPFINFVYSRTHADGTRQYFQMSGEPIFGPTGAYTGYRGVGMDVTEYMRHH